VRGVVEEEREARLRKKKQAVLPFPIGGEKGYNRAKREGGKNKKKETQRERQEVCAALHDNRRDGGSDYHQREVQKKKLGESAPGVGGGRGDLSVDLGRKGGRATDA